jgi:hypothetical protein
MKLPAFGKEYGQLGRKREVHFKSSAPQEPGRIEMLVLV